MNVKDGRPGVALVDVAVSDPNGASEFYGELFGWEFDPELWPNGYRYARVDGSIVAGIRPLNEQESAKWDVYFGVDDVEAVAAKISDLAGRVVFGPNDAGGAGKVAIALDTAFGAFGLWEAGAGWDFIQGRDNALVWSELVTPEASVDEFYSSVFGFETRQIGEGAFDYTIWTLDGDTSVGRLKSSDGEDASWTPYFGVNPSVGTDKVVARAAELGAQILFGPADIPAGRVGTLRDPFGARFSLVDLSRSAR
ncbi:VOC family protein [Rhodococcus sp. IC4_135]|uniref:VOC family protein n=1 Tax=Rhodococcus sp. IC4_135 TaxID=2715537 RepID=UPI0014235FCF|nr:VOC family protein [Rhodococcus sp. IC4_135]